MKNTAIVLAFIAAFATGFALILGWAYLTITHLPDPWGWLAYAAPFVMVPIAVALWKDFRS